MQQFFTIATNAFMELVRQPVFLLLMTCSAVFTVFLAAVPYFGFGDDPKLVKDSTLAVMLLSGLFGAVLNASASVAHEIRSGTALAVLAKPVGRAQFLLAKYLGLAAALTVLTYVNANHNAGAPIPAPAETYDYSETQKSYPFTHYADAVWDSTRMNNILDHFVTDQVSIGRYVLAGGELAAMVVSDTVLRKLPGVLGKDESAVEESFSEALDGGLEYPHYTRPAEWRGWSVPEVLLSGHHEKIREWRREQSRQRSLP